MVQAIGSSTPSTTSETDHEVHAGAAGPARLEEHRAQLACRVGRWQAHDGQLDGRATGPVMIEGYGEHRAVEVGTIWAGQSCQRTAGSWASTYGAAGETIRPSARSGTTSPLTRLMTVPLAAATPGPISTVNP